MTPVYSLVDTETTGLEQPEPPASGVVEVGEIQFDPITLEVLCEGSVRVNPGCPIQEGASKVHGIYDADVVGCPTLAEVWGSDDPIVMGGHNHKFDYARLAPYCPNIVGTFCTLDLARQWLRGPPNYKLQTLVEYYDLKRGAAHSALGDCYSNLQLLHLVVRESNKTVPELVTATGTRRMILKMLYGKHKGMSIHELPLSYISWFLNQEIDADLRYSLQHSYDLRSDK